MPPNMMEAVCAACAKKEPYEASLHFCQTAYLYLLQRGGFPFKANALTVEQWQDIGLLRDEYEAMRAETSMIGAPPRRAF